MAAPSLAVLAGLLSTGGAAQDAQMEAEAASAETASSPAETLTEIKYSSDQGQAPYQVTFISVSYKRSEGLVQLPGSDETSDICRESQPWGSKMVEWAVARLRLPPKIPTRPETDNETLAFEEVSAIAMSVMPDGRTPVYYRKGFQLYMFGVPPAMGTDDLKSPKNPGLNVETPAISEADREEMVAPLDD